MARGGYRPSAGRPVGSKTAKPDVKAAEVALSGPPDTVIFTSALDFAMHVINDKAAEMSDKIRLAIAAMPFQHARLSEVVGSKKEKAQAEADTAGHGTTWGDDLDTDARLN